MATIKLNRPVQVETWRRETGCGTFKLGNRVVCVNAENISPKQPQGAQLFRAILSDVVILAQNGTLSLLSAVLPAQIRSPKGE